MHNAKLKTKSYIRCTVAGKNWKEAKLTCKREESELLIVGIWRYPLQKILELKTLKR